jgi:general secretion pathway protein C
MRLPTLTLPKIDAASLRANAPALITGLLVLALTVTGVQLARSAVAWWQEANTTGATTLPIASAATVPVVDPSAIANAHLFGSPVAGEMAIAPVSGVPLVLVGTIAFENPAAGFAIIGESAQAARFVRAGSAIMAGSTLVSVFRDRVMVDRGGTLQAVILPRELPPGMFIADANDPAVDAGGQAAPVNLSLGSGGGGRPRNKRMAAAETQAMYDFPPELGRAAQVSTVIVDGRLRGYKLEPGKDPKVFKALGMQSGDVVIAVNGYPVWHPEGRLAMVNALLPGEQIELAVTRGTGYTELTVDGKRLAGMTLSDYNPQRNRPGKAPRPIK